MERFLHFLILYDLPGWLKKEDLPRLVPTSGVPSIASFRSWIALVDESTIDAVCPPRPRCYGEGVREVADKVLREVFQALSKLDERREAWHRRLLDRADEIIEYGLRGVEPVMCTEPKNLGCFIPAGGRGGSREPDELAQYPGPLILVNAEGIERIRLGLLDRYDEILNDWDRSALGRYLLEAVIAHEVTHAYTDLAHEGAPAKVLQRHTQRFYYEVIEESLATYYGLREFLGYNSILGRIITVELLSEAPIEYRAGYSWHSLLGNEVTNEVIERWVTGASIGTLRTIIALSAPYLYRYRSRLYIDHLLFELRRLSRYSVMVLEEIPTLFWKILALELVKSAKPDSLRVKMS